MGQMKQYHEMRGLEHVYFEDSFVTKIVEELSQLTFVLEAVLTNSHPEYASPRINEQYCYHPARLEFPNVRRLTWESQNFREFTDAAGDTDYGNIDVFYESSGLYYLEGDWGRVQVESDPPIFRLMKPGGV